MTKTEAMRITHLTAALGELGFTCDQISALRRASNTLRRWYEAECDGEIQRDEESDLPYRYSTVSHKRRYKVADREKGARARIAAIVATTPAHKVEGFYIQSDPRGAALYILRPDDVPEGKEADAYYSRGICVY